MTDVKVGDVFHKGGVLITVKQVYAGSIFVVDIKDKLSGYVDHNRYRFIDFDDSYIPDIVYNSKLWKELDDC